MPLQSPFISSRSISLFLAWVLVVSCTTGCTLVKLKKEIDRSHESMIIVGRVHETVPGEGPIIVAARSVDGDKAIAHYTVLHDTGEYELLVELGRYHVFAFRDTNRNMICDDGESSGQYGRPNVVIAQSVGVIYDIDIAIQPAAHGGPIPSGLKIARAVPENFRSRQAGVITDLSDKRFSAENGVRGFWEPYSFYRELGGNIYFLEKYDPNKIPVLFIHGATGTPAGWNYFVDHIDRTRYQPWFFYYPTGVRIDSMAYLLFWKLINLQSRYKFNTLYITAHSMGGLVARSFIINYGQHFPYVKLFISLATPWGGDRMAEYGVRQSPVSIPSWIDMQPDGDFITSLYRTEMPKSVSFYMFCGYMGNRNPFRSNNDGTITLNSILDRRAQSEARMNYVFNEDHSSILSSEDVVSQYNAVLDEFEAKQDIPAHRSGGYLKFNVSYDYGTEGLRPQYVFILRSADRKNVETVSYISAYDKGALQGPFPAGRYRVSLLTAAAKTLDNAVPITIEIDKTTDLHFRFTPDGQIFGLVGTALKPEDKTPGWSGTLYRSIDESIIIESVTLSGNGLRRVLKPIEGHDVTFWDLAISHNDFCYQRYFCFFGLPAGDYTLVIRAKGFKPFERKFTVVPGIPGDFKTAELTHE